MISAAGENLPWTGQQVLVDFLLWISDQEEEHFLNREDLMHYGVVLRLHPAPLPRYAGHHSLSWALLNNERSHGIAWHMVEDMSTTRRLEKDGGKVWFTASFDIQQTHEEHPDTRATLIKKCTQTTIESLPSLLDDELMKRGECGSEANDQNTKMRSKDYHARYERVPMIVAWDEPYEAILTLHTASTFPEARFILLRVTASALSDYVFFGGAEQHVRSPEGSDWRCTVCLFEL